MGRRVAVIGAGPSGLVAINTLLEGGHSVQGFETSSFLGGMWNYDHHTSSHGEEHGYEVADGLSYSIYHSLRLLTSIYTAAFSDYVPDHILKHGQHFLTHHQYHSYIHDYANHFQLHQHIKFSATVLKLTKSTKSWKVTYKIDKDILEECFEFVFVASGPCSFPCWLDVPGLQNYQGVLVHSSQVRREVSLFRGQRVLVIGGGFSGGDMVTSAARAGSRCVYWSMTGKHRSHWCCDRYVEVSLHGSKPWETLINRQEYDQTGGDFWKLLKPVLRPLYTVGNSETIPTIPGDAVSITDTGFLEKAFNSGEIVKVAKISGITVDNDRHIHLEDSTVLQDIDVIVAATGFRKSFPYLDDIWSAEEQEKCQLFQFVISPNKELDGVGFLNMATGPVSLFTVMEMQAWWLSWRMLSKHYDDNECLYTIEERQLMQKNIQEKRFILNPYDYLDGLARDMGCLPPDTDMLLQSHDRKDIELATALLHGPLSSTQYRLTKNNREINGMDASVRQTLIKVAKLILGNKFEELVIAIIKNQIQ